MRTMALPVYSFDDGDYWGNIILNDLENLTWKK